MKDVDIMNYFLNDTLAAGNRNTQLSLSDWANRLGAPDASLREKARQVMLAAGPPALDYLGPSVKHDLAIVRYETVKILCQMDDPLTIPLLIQALSDSKSSIRWMAAEGLVRHGETAVKPLLLAMNQSLAEDHLHLIGEKILLKICPENIRELLQTLNRR